MSNLIAVEPPFRFSGQGLESLNDLFKPVQKFEVIYYTESISDVTPRMFNVVGAVCDYIKTRNHTDGMLERYAIIEASLRESLKQYKIKIDTIVEIGIEKIKKLFELFTQGVRNQVESIVKKYRNLRTKVLNKIENEKEERKIKEQIIAIFERIKKSIELAIENFKDIASDYSEYNRLNDIYVEIVRKYLSEIKKEEDYETYAS